MNKAVILLSSGLDSVVSLYKAKENFEIMLALTFDYGQKSAYEEINCAKKIAKKFNIEHKAIELPFLKDEVKNALTEPDIDLANDVLGEKSRNKVWVPNRNGLFLNIAAFYAEARGLDYIIIGANKEEAQTFPDNSFDFIKSGENFFNFSTLTKPKILAPLIELKKAEIVALGVSLGVDFSLIKSCYDFKGHCGVCESCIRLKNALIDSGNSDLIKLIF